MKPMKKIAILGVAAVVLTAVLWMASGSRRGMARLTYSQFLEQVRAGQVASVTVLNSGAARAILHRKDGTTVQTVLPSDYRVAATAMQDNAVNVEIQDPSTEPLRLLLNTAPFLLLLGMWIFLLLRKFPDGPPALARHH